MPELEKSAHPSLILQEKQDGPGGRRTSVHYCARGRSVQGRSAHYRLNSLTSAASFVRTRAVVVVRTSDGLTLPAMTASPSGAARANSSGVARRMSVLRGRRSRKKCG